MLNPSTKTCTGAQDESISVVFHGMHAGSLNNVIVCATGAVEFSFFFYYGC